MNKQEVIETLKSEARHHCGEKECYKDGCTKNVELDTAINIINRIDEPEKPVVLQYVADWYERNKDDLNTSIYSTITRIFMKANDEDLLTAFESWLMCNENSIVTVVSMHQFGYEVEKEKLYSARFKLLDDDVEECYINQTIDDKKLFLGNLDENNYVKVFFTQEELKKLGLWENALIDTDEVKDDRILYPNEKNPHSHTSAKESSCCTW